MKDATGVGREPVDWDKLELQIFNLKFEPLSPEDRLRKARDLAAAFKTHREPLPPSLDSIYGLSWEEDNVEFGDIE